MKHCKLIDHDTSLSLIFTKIDTGYALFEKAEVEGNGYDWEALIKTELKKSYPEMLQRVGFDPEASMFVAYGTDKEALEVVAQLLDKAVEDEQQLAQWIDAVDPDDWD